MSEDIPKLLKKIKDDFALMIKEDPAFVNNKGTQVVNGIVQ